MALTNKLSAIGDAIRGKTGKSDLLTLDQMVTEINSITTGSGDIIVSDDTFFEDWIISGWYIDENGFNVTTMDSYINERVTMVTIYGLTSVKAKSISLPEVTNISTYAFANNAYIQSVDLPKLKLDEISDAPNAFENCYDLKNINIPLVTILSDNFFKATGLEQIRLNNVEIGGHYILSNCSYLKKVDLPNVIKLGFSCFDNNPVLTEVNLPKLKEIENQTFLNCSSLESISLPLLQNAGSQTFYNCSKLKNVDLPNLVNIGDSFFNNCTSLTEIKLPKISSLMKQEFYRCNNLTKADFSALRSIENPSSYYSPFRECTALDTVILRYNGVCQLISSSTNLFQYCTKFKNGTGFIYVPSAFIEEYKSATNWAPYADQFRAIEDYPDICG